MQYYPFDSRNPLYRSHIGAVASGENLKLRLLLHNDALCSDAYLILRNDKDSSTQEISLTPAEYLNEYRFWECEIALETGLYWYTFRYNSCYGEFKVTKCSHSVGYVSNDGESWQQTVYDKDFTTPSWLEGGVIYQIFPDRFFQSTKRKTNVPTDRFIVTNKTKTPEFKQNNGPCSLGNDYYCGDILGIAEKLPYIASLGVNCIYLNPIFEAHSNHRYDTANYKKIDTLLGNESDLKTLCAEAKKLGIGVILDGVFSHTGADSLYFNKFGRYGKYGAFNSKNSKYYSWFNFKEWPNDYHCWWDVPSLPETNENDKNFCEFITGENGVVRHWIMAFRVGALTLLMNYPMSLLRKFALQLKLKIPTLIYSAKFGKMHQIKQVIIKDATICLAKDLTR